MARMAYDNGITHAVVTPHLHPGRWENTFSAARPVFAAYQREVARAGIPLELGLACEARLDPELLGHLQRDELPFLGSLGDEKLMLLELPHGQIPLGADRFAAKLIGMGIRPIIAHPERNRQAMRGRDRLAVFESLGCLFQITAGSLLGKFGRAAEDLALELLTSSSTFLVASDAHNTRVRIPELLSARDVAAEVIGADRATALVSANPWRVARGHFEGPSSDDTAAGQAPPADAKPRPAIRVATRSDAAAAPGRGAAQYSAPRTDAPAQRFAAAGAAPAALRAAAPVAEARASRYLQSPQEIEQQLQTIMQLAEHLPTEVLGPLALDLARMCRDRQ